MKIRLVIAAGIAAGTYLGMQLMSGGSTDPALLAWCASGIFGLALGFATLNRIPTARLFPLGPQPLARPARAERVDASAELPDAATSPHTTSQPQAV